MEKMYLLYHMYDYGEHNEHEEIKALGIYSSEQEASEAIERYYQLAGFKLFPKECFGIDEYQVDMDTNWREGFVNSVDLDRDFETLTACFNKWLCIDKNPRESWEDMLLAQDELFEKLKRKSITNEELSDCLNSKYFNVVGMAVLTVIERSYCDGHIIKMLTEIASASDGYKVGPYQMRHLAAAALFLVRDQPALECFTQIYSHLDSNDRFLVDNFIEQYEKGRDKEQGKELFR